MKKDSKELIIQQLKKTPIVHLACEKMGVARSTFYRWKNNDAEFSKKADEAMSEGLLLINDMAESQLISAIRDGNMTSIIFWLRNHHKLYRQRLEINGQIKHVNEELTPEQEKVVLQALRLSSIVTAENIKRLNNVISYEQLKEKISN